MTVSFFLLVVLKSHIHTIFDDNSPTTGEGDGEKSNREKEGTGETSVPVIITIILTIQKYYHVFI